MPERDQFLGQPVHDPFGSAIQFRRNSLRQRSDLRDAHLTISCFCFCGTQPLASSWHPACRNGNVLGCAKFLRTRALVPHRRLAMPSQPLRLSITEMLQNCCAVMAARGEIANGAVSRPPKTFPGRILVLSNRFAGHMDNLSGYARRPFAFVLRYLRRRPASHVVILTAV